MCAWTTNCHGRLTFDLFSGAYILSICFSCLLFFSYYIENFEFESDEEEEDEELTWYLFDLLASDGIFATQVGDAPTLRTAAQGNPNIQDRFDFIDSLQSNGFVRIVDYEEVRIYCIALL